MCRQRLIMPRDASGTVRDGQGRGLLLYEMSVRVAPHLNRCKSPSDLLRFTNCCVCNLKGCELIPMPTTGDIRHLVNRYAIYEVVSSNVLTTYVTA